MNSGELGYLIMAIGAVVIFAVTLAYANWVAPGDRMHPGE